MTIVRRPCCMTHSCPAPGGGEFWDKIIPSRETMLKTESARLALEGHFSRLQEETVARQQRHQQFLETVHNKGYDSDQQKILFQEFASEESRISRFSRSRLKENRFTKLKLIGRGGFGEVWLVKDSLSGQLFAMKVLSKADIVLKDQINNVRTERDILSRTANPWIVHLCASFQDQHKLFLLLDYIPGGDLMTALIRKKTFNENEAKFFAAEIALALNSIHQMDILHRDLKPENILINEEGHIRLTDFGLSSYEKADRNLKKVLQEIQDELIEKALKRRRISIKHQRETRHGTCDYTAPEILSGQVPTAAADFWSLGVILYEMMNFSYPFLARDASDLGRKVVMGKYIMPSYTQYSPDLISVVRRLLQVNPMLRPSTEELLNMQCIKERKRMLDRFLKSETLQLGEKLLDTIKVPDNIKNINLPNPTYNVKADIIKPIDQRLHFKKGVPLYKKIDLVSSPELQLVTDCDWWTPIRPNTNLRTEKEYQVHEPTSQSSLERVQTDNVHIVNFSRLDEIPPSPQRAPRRYVPPPPMINAIRNPSHYRNSRFKRQAIR